MASPLQPVSLVAAGFFGLNTQDSSISLPPQFALVAENAVIDSFGRLGARKGSRVISDTQFAAPIKMMHQHINKDATKEVYFATGSDFYSLSSDGTTTLEYTSAALDSNWQGISFNGDFYAFQDGQAPVFHHITDGHGWEVIGADAHTSLPAGVTWLGTATASYGRVWAARTNLDKTTVYYSDTLIGHVFQGGASGALNLETVFPAGSDEIVAIRGFNGFLVIFCKNNIVIYSGAEDPTTMALSDVIVGVGCIERDTIQDTGTDLIFLSGQGLRSLNRVIQEKSSPQRDLSKNIRDQFVNDVLAEPNSIKSVYSPKDAFYLLTLQNTQRVYCFDLRAPLEDGASRVTTWSNVAPTSFYVDRDTEDLFMGQEDGWVSQYDGYNDNGNSYKMNYLTSYIDGGNQAVIKILKEAVILLLGGSEDVVNLKYDVDYGTAFTPQLKTLPLSTTAVYNESEYGIATYSQGQIVNRIKYNLSKAGRVFQLGLEIDVLNDPISIQQIDVFFKQGRLV